MTKDLSRSNSENRPPTLIEAFSPSERRSGKIEIHSSALIRS